MTQEEDLQKLFEYLYPDEVNDNKYHLEFENDDDYNLIGIGFYKEGDYCWSMSVQDILFNYIIKKGV